MHVQDSVLTKQALYNAWQSWTYNWTDELVLHVDIKLVLHEKNEAFS